MKIFIANPHKTIVRSTDHDYVHKQFIQLQKTQNIEFIINKSIVSRMHRDFIYIADRVRLIFSGNKKRLKRNPYSDAYLISAPKDCDLIFSYGGFPLEIMNKSGKPIVCEQTFAYGGVLDSESWKKHIRTNRKFYVKVSQKLITPSLESMNEFKIIFPEHADKINYVPYFLPYLKPISKTKLEEKYTSMEKIKFLFVGKEAKRKGLGKFVEVYHRLSQEQKNRMEITVISKFMDGTIPLPTEFNYKSYVEDITVEFQSCHVLIFLTKQEAYGLVLVEALANGCNVLTTNHAIQRSIMNNTGGWFVDPNDEVAILIGLESIFNSSKEILLENAINNLNNFIQDKSPEIVSTRIYEVFQSLIPTK